MAKEPCPDCDDGMVECDECGGTGNVMCGTCEGMGEIDETES
jgi:hypothetical protein